MPELPNESQTPWVHSRLDTRYLSTLNPPEGADASTSSPLTPDAVAGTFDLCHVGVVLRAVLGVQLLLALGVGVTVPSLRDWLLTLSSATVVSLSAVLMWLVLVCLGQRWLARRDELMQWAATVGLGLLCTLPGWWVYGRVQDVPPSSFRGAMVVLAGGAVAALLVSWLKLRARAKAPAEARAHLSELQARIRPHFLFNTLNTAIALVRLDPGRAEAVLESLAELFHAALAENRAVVTLEDELTLVQRYLEIEQVRFGGRLRLHWHLDPKAGKVLVPPLLLQPLIENAVRHGVEPNEQGGDVEIRSEFRGDRVELTVRNTVGERTGAPGQGMALDNVRQRLRLMHDVRAQFDVKQRPDQFRVRLMLPCQA